MTETLSYSSKEVLEADRLRIHEQMVKEAEIELGATFYHQGYLMLIYAGYEDDYAFNEMSRYQANELGDVREWRMMIERFVGNALAIKKGIALE